MPRPALPAGELSSDDDFYLLAPSGLEVLQTTNSVLDRSLYQRLMPRVGPEGAARGAGWSPCRAWSSCSQCSWAAAVVRVCQEAQLKLPGSSAWGWQSRQRLRCQLGGAVPRFPAERTELAACLRRLPARRRRARVDRRDCTAQQRHGQQPVDGDSPHASSTSPGPSLAAGPPTRALPLMQGDSTSAGAAACAAAPPAGG